MKKIFSIFFALLILLSGTHLSIAKHICGGQVAAVKWSFSGEKAVCGMERIRNSCASPINIAESDCCKNIINFYSVDENYNPSATQMKVIAREFVQEFTASVNLLSKLTEPSVSFHNYFGPPNIAFISAVNLDEICVFRI